MPSSKIAFRAVPKSNYSRAYSSLLSHFLLQFFNLMHVLFALNKGFSNGSVHLGYMNNTNSRDVETIASFIIVLTTDLSNCDEKLLVGEYYTIHNYPMTLKAYQLCCCCILSLLGCAGIANL